MPDRDPAGLSTQKVAVAMTAQSLVHPSWAVRSSKRFAPCSMYQRNLYRFLRKRDESYGTNFRHAVEFSRSGRAPSRPFQAGRGQPEIRYLVGFARSNVTGLAQSRRMDVRRGQPARDDAPARSGASQRGQPQV